jgi:hypothetical protein
MFATISITIINRDLRGVLKNSSIRTKEKRMDLGKPSSLPYYIATPGWHC